MNDLQRLVARFQHRLNTDWRSRWLTANLVGWISGLFGGVLLLRLLPGWIGLVLALLMVGAGIGSAQAWALRGYSSLSPRRWVFQTALGLVLASPFVLLILVPVGAFALTARALLPALVAGLLAGGIAGLLLGLLQSRLLNQENEVYWRWVLACAGGGALCGLLTLLPIIPGLPVGLTAGALIYGWVTAALAEQLPLS